jgi:NAD(P)-dependent dehydrogenase (short-subunit alcohol dehydrogenase family)
MMPPTRHDGHGVIVTGGASGIGRAVVELVLQRGGCVGVVDLDPSKVDDLRELHPGRLITLAGSVLDPEALRHAWTGCTAELPEPVTGLVNCAGIPPAPVGIEQLEIADWTRIVDSHLHGTFVSCKTIGAELASAGRGGSIVNLASVLAFRPGPVLAYAAAKSGVVSLTSALAVHWASQGVRVNAVAPGWTDTPFLRPKDRAPRDFGPIVAATPMGRLLKPREIAEVICFLLSPAASAVTGSTIPCDGGVMAGSGWAPYGGFPTTEAHARADRLVPAT